MIKKDAENINELKHEPANFARYPGRRRGLFILNAQFDWEEFQIGFPVRVMILGVMLAGVNIYINSGVQSLTNGFTKVGF